MEFTYTFVDRIFRFSMSETGDFSGALYGGDFSMSMERREVEWLPAIESRGEGLFIAFRKTAVNEWFARAAVQERARRLEAGFQAWRADHEGSRREFPGMPYVMLHTLSHLLLTAVSLECGYPASSLRERVYASKKGYGILIYTARGAAACTRSVWSWIGQSRSSRRPTSRKRRRSGTSRSGHSSARLPLRSGSTPISTPLPHPASFSECRACNDE
jgi:hypothetical protein